MGLDSKKNINDSAIEFQAKCYNLNIVLELLRSIGIDTQNYERRFNQINSDVIREIAEYNAGGLTDGLVMKTLNQIYADAIVGLDKILEQLQKYDSYVKAYYTYESYSKAKSGKIDDNQLREYVNLTISNIEAVNGTDTREYDEEKVAVERVYSMAYQLMKLEFATFGASNIFDYAQQNPSVAGYIANEIEKNIHDLEADGKITAEIEKNINRIRSTGINCSFLDASLICALVSDMDGSTVKQIKDDLAVLYKGYTSNANGIETLVAGIDEQRENIMSTTKNIRKNRNGNIKRAIVAIVAAATLLGLNYGASRWVARKKTYRTTKEIFSTQSGHSIFEYYDKKMAKSRSSELSIYYPYESQWPEYRRNYETYHVENIDSECRTLNDYLQLNFDEAADKKNGVQLKRKGEMSDEDFYDREIYEVIRIIQNLDEPDIYYDKTIFWLLFGVLSCCADLLIIRKYCQDFRSNKDDKQELQKSLGYLKESVMGLRNLIASRTDLQQEFDRLYSLYGPLIDNFELDKISIPDKPILIEDPAQALTRKRLKKIVANGVGK